jgi:hypothetical protein
VCLDFVKFYFATAKPNGPWIKSRHTIIDGGFLDHSSSKNFRRENPCGQG